MKRKVQDISQVLSTWAYEESQTVRRFKAKDGREVIQIRLPLGIEQYELDGRPDGQRPMGADSWLDYYLGEAKSAQKEGRELALGPEDFSRLQQEGLLYYYRYLLFFQIQDYERCSRDTGRNLRLLDFVTTHCDKEAADLLEQYRPYILRMNAMARAMLRYQENRDAAAAVRILQSAKKEIDDLPPLEGNVIFDFEKNRSTKAIDELLAQLEQHLPRHLTLQNQLEKAIQAENYERAATLRDEIAALSKRSKKI